jgi:hypothetical protein
MGNCRLAITLPPGIRRNAYFWESPDSETELIQLTGAKTVSVLVVDGKPVEVSEEINQFLVGKFILR